MRMLKTWLPLASSFFAALTGCVDGAAPPAGISTNDIEEHEPINDSGSSTSDSGDTTDYTTDVDMAFVCEAVGLLTDPSLLTGAGLLASANALVTGMTDEEKQLAADRIDEILPENAIEHENAPAAPPSADRSQSVPLKWGYSGKLSSSHSTTTACDGDTDASFYYSSVTNAYSAPSHLKVYESDQVLYAAMRFTWSALTAYRITSGNNVYICVGAEIDSATTAALVGAELAYNLSLYGYSQVDVFNAALRSVEQSAVRGATSVYGACLPRGIGCALRLAVTGANAQGDHAIVVVGAIDHLRLREVPRDQDAMVDHGLGQCGLPPGRY